MIQSLIIRIVERIPTIKDFIKHLVNVPLFHLDCGFLISDSVPSKATYFRIIRVMSQSNVLDIIQDELIKTSFLDGFLCGAHLAHLCQSLRIA